jgi:hypothetical protein
MRRFWIPVAGLLILMAAAMAVSASLESPCFDESAYLTDGYLHLRGEGWRIGDHPPLAKLLAAWPVRALGPEIPTSDKQAFWDYAYSFVNRNRVPAGKIMMAARVPFMLLALGLGVAIALWAKKRFGTVPALLSTLLYAADPNFLAHGHYVGTDLVLALFFFLTVVLWSEWLAQRRWPYLVATGLSLGLALLSKFSGVLLPPLLVVLAAIFFWRERRIEIPRVGAGFAVVLLIAAALVGVGYGPGAAASSAMLKDVVNRSNPVGYVFGTLGEWFDWPAHPFLLGVEGQARHNESGHAGYLLGELSNKGWWYYFPVAFAVKTPLATLGLLLIGLALALWRGKLRRFREMPFATLAALVSALFYFGFALASRINIGLRYLLPMYPFLFVLAAALLFEWLPERRARWVAAVAGAFLVTEIALISPHYLSFFNWASGGAANGSRYLLDSNIDWGQDLIHLKRHMDRHGLRSVCLAYFGRGDPDAYGIRSQTLPFNSQAATPGQTDCVAAISVTLLHDLYLPPGAFAWARARRPFGRVGYSMLLYDLRRGAPAIR